MVVVYHANFFRFEQAVMCQKRLTGVNELVFLQFYPKSIGVVS